MTTVESRTVTGHHRQSPHRTLRTLAAAAAAAVTSLLAAITPLPASAETGTPAFLTSGTVTLYADTAGQYFAPGTVYFQIDVHRGEHLGITSMSGYAGSWDSPQAALDYIATDYAANGDCEVAELRAYIQSLGLNTEEEFMARFGTGQADGLGWDLPQDVRAAAIAKCGPLEWGDGPVVSQSNEAGDTMTYFVPVDFFGPGTHQLFLQPLQDACPRSDGGYLPECVLVTYGNHEFALLQTRLTSAGEPVYTTITVPDPSTVVTLDPSARTNADPLAGGGAAPKPDATNQATPSPAPAAAASATPIAAAATTNTGFPLLLIPIAAVFVLAGVVVLVIVLARRTRPAPALAGTAIAPGRPTPPFGGAPVPTPASWNTTTAPQLPPSAHPSAHPGPGSHIAPMPALPPAAPGSHIAPITLRSPSPADRPD